MIGRREKKEKEKGGGLRVIYMNKWGRSKSGWQERTGKKNSGEKQVIAQVQKRKRLEQRTYLSSCGILFFSLLEYVQDFAKVMRKAP